MATLATAAIVLVLLLPGFLVIHIGGAFIQILIMIAVIVVILHFVGGVGLGSDPAVRRSGSALSTDGPARGLIVGRRGRLLGDNAVMPVLGCG